MITIKNHKKNPNYNKEIHIGKDIKFLVNMKGTHVRDWTIILSSDPLMNVVLKEIENHGSTIILNIIRELRNNLMKKEYEKLIEGT